MPLTDQQAEQLAKDLIDQAKTNALNSTHIDQVKFNKGYVKGIQDFLKFLKEDGK